METLVLYLPGSSVYNKDEGGNIVEHLREEGHDVYFHQWRHWDNPEIKFDLEHEISAILEKLKTFEFKNLNIVCKSIGTYVTINLLAQSDLQVSTLVLMGIPVKDLSIEEIELYKTTLSKFTGNITVIHNRNDEHGSILDLQPIITSGFKHRLIIQESDNHKYNYPEFVKLVLDLNA